MNHWFPRSIDSIHSRNVYSFPRSSHSRNFKPYLLLVILATVTSLLLNQYRTGATPHIQCLLQEHFERSLQALLPLPPDMFEGHRHSNLSHLHLIVNWSRNSDPDIIVLLRLRERWPYPINRVGLALEENIHLLNTSWSCWGLLSVESLGHIISLHKLTTALSSIRNH